MDMQHLDSGQCLDLLRTKQVGRLGVIAEHYPMIFVVNYGLDGDVVIVRSDPGTKLRAASHANVSFEVDEIDDTSQTGWSVLILALAEEVTEAHREQIAASTHKNAVQPWDPGEHGHLLRLIPHRVTGRRIRRAVQVPGSLGSVNSL